jgi:hypothetical protein
VREKSYCPFFNAVDTGEIQTFDQYGLGSNQYNIELWSFNRVQGSLICYRYAFTLVLT